RHRLARAGPAAAPADRPREGRPVAVRRCRGGARRPGRDARWTARLRGGGGGGRVGGGAGDAALGGLPDREGQPARRTGARRAGRGLPGGAPGQAPVRRDSPTATGPRSVGTNWAV